MLRWIVELKRALEAAGVKVYLARKYMDDVMLCPQKLKLGSRWTEKAIIWSEEA